MTTDPDRLRAQVAELLDSVDIDRIDSGVVDIDDVARRLEQAHDVLVQALESVEKD